jgi:hypothetical protein
MRPPASTFPYLAALLVLMPGAVLGQRPSPQPGEAPGWAPIEIGAHIGFDSDGFTDAFVLGAQLRVPVWPSGHVEVVPNGSITFRSRLKDYELAPDLVVVTGGRGGGLYLGGGPLWLNTIFDGPDRATELGWSFVVGLRSSRVFGAPFGTQIQLRQSYVADFRRRRVLSLGVNFPLWGRRESARAR